MIWLELDGRHSLKARGWLNGISLILRRGQCCQSRCVIGASPAPHCICLAALLQGNARRSICANTTRNVTLIPTLPLNPYRLNPFKIISVPSAFSPSCQVIAMTRPFPREADPQPSPCSCVCVTTAGSELCLSAGIEQSERHVILFPLLH